MAFLKEAKSLGMHLLGHLSHLAVTYGVPLGGLYILERMGLMDGLLFAFVPLAVVWVFTVWWLTASWSGWGSPKKVEGLRFNRERAAALIKEHQVGSQETTIPEARPRSLGLKVRSVLVAVTLVLVGAAATAGYYELNDRYERCILRNMPGVPASAAKLIDNSCRRLSW